MKLLLALVTALFVFADPFVPYDLSCDGCYLTEDQTFGQNEAIINISPLSPGEGFCDGICTYIDDPHVPQFPCLWTQVCTTLTTLDVYILDEQYPKYRVVIEQVDRNGNRTVESTSEDIEPGGEYHTTTHSQSQPGCGLEGNGKLFVWVDYKDTSGSWLPLACAQIYCDSCAVIAPPN